LTLKNYTAKYYDVRKIWFLAYLTNFLSSIEENCTHVYIVFNCYNMSVFCKHNQNVWQIIGHKYQKYPHGYRTIHFETGTLYGCITSPVLDSLHSMYRGMMLCMSVLPTPM
jgi:hypothetical protein